MTTKFTPGPWKAVLEPHNGDSMGPHWAIFAADTTTIARSDYLTESNARLIAAAPETAAERDKLKAINAELLAAAEALYRWAAQQPGFDASEWKDVRAAISRATVTP